MQAPQSDVIPNACYIRVASLPCGISGLKNLGYFLRYFHFRLSYLDTKHGLCILYRPTKHLDSHSKCPTNQQIALSLCPAFRRRNCSHSSSGISPARAGSTVRWVRLTFLIFASIIVSFSWYHSQRSTCNAALAPNTDNLNSCYTPSAIFH